MARSNACLAVEGFREINKNEFRWTETRADLAYHLQNGLNALYQQVFADPPYNEVFTDGDVETIFHGYLELNGLLLTLDDEISNRPVAFMVATPLKADFMNVCGMPRDLDLPCTAYIAEDGVAAPFRRQGISSTMKKMVLERLARQGYSDAILRTSAANTAQTAAVLAAGGETIVGAKQMVERCTKFGKVMEDNRFFRFRLKG